MQYDVAILGAGAAGLMAAAYLNEHSTLRVCLIEGNPKPGAKIRISGGGKCNLTNVSVSEQNYLGDARLVREVLQRFDAPALLDWVRTRGCEPVLRKARYYFCPHSAQELIDILTSSARNCRFYFEHTIQELRTIPDGFNIRTSRGDLTASRVIVATGGASYASVGATDVGLRIAQGLGLRAVAFRPALAGLTLQREQFWMKALSGISLPVRIHVGRKELKEDLLFAHRGISGPAVLSASLYWEKGEITIDFLNGKRLETLLADGGKKKISTALPLPKRFAVALLEQLGISDKPCSALNGKEIETLGDVASYRFAPAGTFGFGKAEVSKGGVAAADLKVPSCESVSVPGLYFVGEVVDVTGELGGYNFQWAFASGRCAAESIAKSG